jgi:hypothetical protein
MPVGVETPIARPESANWALAHIHNPMVLMFSMLTTASIPTLGEDSCQIKWKSRPSMQVVRNQVAHVAELADALDSGSSE